MEGARIIGSFLKIFGSGLILRLLQLTHPHLAVPVTEEFSLKATDLWQRVREAVDDENSSS